MVERTWLRFCSPEDSLEDSLEDEFYKFDEMERTLFFAVLVQVKENFRLKALAELNLVLNSCDSNQNLEFVDKLSQECIKVSNLISKLKLCLANPKNFGEFKEELLYRQISAKGNMRSEKDDTTVQPKKGASFEGNPIHNLELKVHTLEQSEMESIANTSDYLILDNIENSYIQRWYKAKVDQEKYRSSDKVEKLDKQIEFYQKLILREIQFEDQLNFIDMRNENLKDAITERLVLYDKSMEELDNVTANKKSELEEVENKLQYFQTLLVEHKQWVIDTKRNDAAKIIQKWWRIIFEKIIAQREAEEKERLKKLKAKEARAKKKAMYK